MLAIAATSIDAEEPLNGLTIGERPEPEVPDGWTTIDVRATSLNHHDLWTLRGVGIREDQLPMILGCDAAGIDSDGREVIVHSVIPSDHWSGDETFDPRRSLLSEHFQGTFAERVAVPQANVVPKPEGLTMAEAACLPTAWLTAYRMLFTNSGVGPGGRILVQGAGGGVATALLALGKAGGFEMWATSRSEAKRQRALELGAAQAFEDGVRLPGRVDAVMETVGAATWNHSVRSVKPGGTIVISGATSGPNPPADLTRIFFQQIRVVGSTMGNRHELANLANFCLQSGVRPQLDSVMALSDARSGFERMMSGEVFGKIVFTVES